MTGLSSGDKPRVLLSLESGIADVRLNRPRKRNALDPEMFHALFEAAQCVRTAAGVRVVVISGEGPDFCAGLDFAAFDAMRSGRRLSDLANLPPTDGPTRGTGQRLVMEWAAVPVPVVAAIHGNALGGGLQLALAADIRIAASDARLSVPEVAWGLVPDMAATQLLPGLVGRDVAKDLVFTARVLTGDEAARVGLVTRTAANPREASLALAREMATLSPDAVRASKRLLDLAGHIDLDSGLTKEQDEISALIGTPNQVEAVEARFEKRPPEFTDV
ncbi:MAG: crotonase/enoyl-CoA hydratase family protein [Chloroflexi bacterium]|nr:crotonase/enoyl-CoA hydratase family protein [Chloroflexota bacterium]